ncbi:MAG: hypothetical protein J6N52_03040 [Clostridia bacterium]|nr:hypothetical protein [Clostridia bacterium]
MKSTKLTKISALISAAALCAGIFSALVYAEETTYVTERIYVDKTVMLCHDKANPKIEVDSDYIALNYNTTGILSFDLGYTGNVSSVKLGIAKWNGAGELYEYGLNNAVYDDYKMNEGDFNTWDSFVPELSTSAYKLTSTKDAFNNYDEIDITDFAAQINSSRYLSIGLKKEGSLNNVCLWAKALAFQPYIEVTRDVTMNASDFVEAVNNSTDEIGVEAAIENYAQATGLDYKRYSMIDHCDIFAKELAGKHYASFEQLKADFNAMLDKYVPKTEIPCEFFAGFNGGEFNCLGKATDSKTIKDTNSNTIIIGYKTDKVNPQTLKGVSVRFKQATDNTSPYKMGFMLKYILSDTYPKIEYGGSSTEVYRNWKDFLAQETAINKKIDISELKDDTFYADMPELVAPLSGNAGKELVLHATIPTNDKNNRNVFNLYMDSSIILYDDISASYVSLQNILDGVASEKEIKEWAEEFGPSYNIDVHALYNMDGVYKALAGKRFNNIDEFCAGFTAAVESNYVTKYIRSNADVTRAGGGAEYEFNNTGLITGNGNGWNMVINSFKIPAGRYVKNMSYVVTYGYNYTAGQEIQIRKYSTSEIPAVPDGTKYEKGTAEHTAWVNYFDKEMKVPNLENYTLSEDAGIGQTTEVKLSEDMLTDVQAGAAQLNLAVTGSGNLQMYSTYNTSGKVPSQLKVVYDKTAFDTYLLNAVNSAANANDVAAALNEYSLALADYEGYEALCDNAKKLVSEEVYGREYASVSEIDAVLSDFAAKYNGQKFVIKSAADNNGTISAEIVNVEGEAQSPVLFAAYYNNNVMVNMVTYSGTDIPAEAYGKANCTIGSYNGAYDSVKVFIFKSFNTIEPWAKSFDVK